MLKLAERPALTAPVTLSIYDQGMTMTLTIDGSIGEGGGQILRTSLSMSALTGQPFLIENIRAGRNKPGLLRQHLTSVRAAAAVCSADVEGDEMGSSRIHFVPSQIRSGDYRFQIGTAGSTTLVCQTILPMLMVAEGPSTVALEGGTHNGMSPSLDFLKRSFLPALEAMGASFSVREERAGFYPAGGGKWSITIEPRPLSSIELLDAPRGHGRLIGRVSQVPFKVLEREHGTFMRRLNLDRMEWDGATIKSPGPGNYLAWTIEQGKHVSCLETVGEKHVRAETVAKRLASRVLKFRASKAAVEEHLADQLLLPMWLVGGGTFTTVSPTQHFLTNAEVLRAFVPDIEIDLAEDGATHRVVIKQKRGP